MLHAACCMLHAALLAQTHPQLAVMRVDVLDLHGQRAANARKEKYLQHNQRVVAQTCWDADIDTVQELSCFGGVENRGFAERYGSGHGLKPPGYAAPPAPSPANRTAAESPPSAVSPAAVNVCVCNSIQVATFSRATATSSGTPTLWHQSRNSFTARAYARRVGGLILAVKHSTKRSHCRLAGVANRRSQLF